MPIEGFSKYHICRNGRLYSIHSGTPRDNTQQCIREGKFYYVGKIRKKQYEEDFKRTHGMES